MASPVQAAQRIHDTLLWRRSKRPEEVTCSRCLRDPNSHYLHPIGYTKNGNPILYSCSGMSHDHSTDGHRAHMIMTFEQTIKLMPPGVEKWVWFADFEGFSVKDCGPVRRPGAL
jgi:CRAL/TRIO domain